jgi:hypothetical protein
MVDRRKRFRTNLRAFVRETKRGGGGWHFHPTEAVRGKEQEGKSLEIEALGRSTFLSFLSIN